MPYVGCPHCLANRECCIIVKFFFYLHHHIACFTISKPETENFFVWPNGQLRNVIHHTDVWVVKYNLCMLVYAQSVMIDRNRSKTYKHLPLKRQKLSCNWITTTLAVKMQHFTLFQYSKDWMKIISIQVHESIHHIDL